MKTPKKVIEKISLPLMFVTFVMAVLMFAVSPVSAAPDLCGLGDFCDQDGDTFFRNHKKCGVCGGVITDCDDSNDKIPDPDTLSCDVPPTPDPTPDPTTLTPCANTFCLASVDKWDRPGARLYVEDRFPGTGSYTQIPPNVFGNILAALSGPDLEFSDLCLAYDVLIFQWKSPPIKNLSWQSLVDYMACGGGVVFEDPSNVDALWPDVATTNIYIHSGTTAPRTIAFVPECVSAFPTLCGSFPRETGPEVPDPNTYEFDIENNHMEFAEVANQPEGQYPKLIPFLRLSEEGPRPIIGLYGEYLTNDKGGRIVLTGPDNAFHGNVETNHPLKEEHLNQLDLLFHEIDWLRGYVEE